jgi:alpha-1,2-mannosyltransferase
VNTRCTAADDGSTGRGARPGLRASVAAAIGGATAIFAFAGAMGLTGSPLVSTLAAAGLAALVGAVFWRRPIVALSETASSRPLEIVSAVATIAALVQLVRLLVFILDPTQTGYALGPARGLGLAVGHSCFTSYFVAAEAVDTTPNVYDDALYSLPGATPGERRQPRRLGTFNIDVYEYPPPYLLLQRGLNVLAPTFLAGRMLWFALDGAVILVGILAAVRMLGPVAGTRALLWSPLIWAADITLSTLQIGNVQPMVIALAMLAMVLVDQRRHAAGGALLAFVTVSKLFPGLLVVYLLVRREWRALAWTTAVSAALVAVSLLDTGWAPYRAFLDHLPGLLGGEAFPAFRNPGAIAKNYSVPGMAFKPALFGLAGLSFGTAKVVGWIYTLVILVATVVVARRTMPRDEQPLIWLSLLILATLRSPFLPPYAAFPPLWLLTLFAARHAPTGRTIVLTLLAWAALNVAIAQNTGDPRLIAVVVLIPQAAMVALTILAMRRAPLATVRA